MGEKTPFRIDLLDDEIESLRLFDPETQRTKETVDQFMLLPAREFPLDAEAINQFLNNWHDHFDHDPSNCALSTQISKKALPPRALNTICRCSFRSTCDIVRLSARPGAALYSGWH